MKGDKFIPGDRVILRNFRDNGFMQLNNQHGVIKRLIDFKMPNDALDLKWQKEPPCQPYEIEMGDKVTLIACACNMDRAEPNKPLDWAWKAKWANCAWQPNLRRLPVNTQAQILREISKKRAYKKLR